MYYAGMKGSRNEPLIIAALPANGSEASFITCHFNGSKKIWYLLYFVDQNQRTANRNTDPHLQRHTSR
jgi:hypothetical protein